MNNLLSPTDLARPAVKIPTEDTDYNHSTQLRFTASSEAGVKLMATTYNGTQTFTSQGKPSDNDHDK